ncbi:MAG: hypothetical protein O7J95_16580, partial [Planctomycetota bacterium]|nr:hypothetical protein [Planctomycetota bacterium]
NLDLPVDLALAFDDDEDPPEVFSIFGRSYEADAVFFVVSRAGGMQGSGALSRVKQQLGMTVSEFTRGMEFGIVFVDAGILKFPSGGKPARASDRVKAMALQFIAQVRGGAGSCVERGLRTALEFASRSSARRQAIVYIGEGSGLCGGDQLTYLQNTLGTVRAKNSAGATIHTIGVSRYFLCQRTFMAQLAASNDGTFQSQGTFIATPPGGGGGGGD